MSTTLAVMLEELKRKAAIEPSEKFTDPDLVSIFQGALGRHNASYTLSPTSSTIPAVERWPVLLLAWSDLQLSRASKFSVQANVSGSQFGTDRNTPFYKCLALHALLLEQYKEATSSLGLTSHAFSVTTSNVTISDIETGIEIPHALSASVTPPMITGPAEVTDGTVILTWESMPSQLHFNAMTLFYDVSSEAIKQPWNSASLTGYPFIRNNLTPLWRTTRQNSNQIKIESIEAVVGDQVRFIFVCSSRSGRYSYSNEHVITVV